MQSLITPLLSLYLFSVLCLVRCESPKNNQDNINPGKYTYFCVDTYFNDFLKSDTIRHVEKTIELNGQIEKKEIENYSIVNDLLEFKKLNLCRAKFIGQYEVDTISGGNSNGNGNGNDTYLYQAKNDDLLIQKVEIEKNKLGIIKSITMQKRRESSVLSSSKLYRFIPEKGYSISSNDSFKIKKPSIKKLTVSYL